MAAKTHVYTTLLVEVTAVINNRIKINPLQHIFLINIVLWLLPSIWGIPQCQCDKTGCHGNHISQKIQ